MVRLTPRGGRNAVDGWDQDASGRTYLKVRVAAAPTEGEANAALTALMAKTLGRPKSAVRIVSGETARIKTLEIDGAEAGDLTLAFGSPDPAQGL